MAQITINYPDQNAIDIRDTLCSVHGWNYQETIDGQVNPESRVAFIKRKIAEYVKSVYVNASAAREAEIAGNTAKATASSVVID